MLALVKMRLELGLKKKWTARHIVELKIYASAVGHRFMQIYCIYGNGGFCPQDVLPVECFVLSLLIAKFVDSPRCFDQSAELKFL